MLFKKTLAVFLHQISFASLLLQHFFAYFSTTSHQKGKSKASISSLLATSPASEDANEVMASPLQSLHVQPIPVCACSQENNHLHLI